MSKIRSTVRYKTQRERVNMEFQCNEGKVSNAPLPENKLIDLIETCYVTSMTESKANPSISIIDCFLKNILEQLNKHSSTYKYVVSVTSLKSLKDDEDDELEEENFRMTNAVGASWNAKKDGLFNYAVRSAEKPRQQYLVTLVWICK